MENFWDTPELKLRKHKNFVIGNLVKEVIIMLNQKRFVSVLVLISMMGILTLSSFAYVNLFIYPHTSLTAAQKLDLQAACKVWDTVGDLTYQGLYVTYRKTAQTKFGSVNYDTVVGAMDFTNNSQNAMIPAIYRSSEILALCLGPDIFMNTNAASLYTSGTEIGKISFKGVLTHELGHVVGLDHSSAVIGDTMYPDIYTIGSPYSSLDLVTLTENDKNRLLQLYSVRASTSAAYSLCTQVEGPARTGGR